MATIPGTAAELVVRERRKERSLARRDDIGFDTLLAIYGNVLLIATAVVAIAFGADLQVLAGSLALAGALCFLAAAVCYHADRQARPAGPQESPQVRDGSGPQDRARPAG
jgi:hypothetical protein